MPLIDQLFRLIAAAENNRAAAELDKALPETYKNRPELQAGFGIAGIAEFAARLFSVGQTPETAGKMALWGQTLGISE